MSQKIKWGSITPEKPCPPDGRDNPQVQKATPEQEYPSSEQPMTTPPTPFTFKK